MTFIPLFTKLGFSHNFLTCWKHALLGRENHWRHCSWYNICFGGLFSSSSSSSIYWIYFYRGLSLSLSLSLFLSELIMLLWAVNMVHICMCSMYSSKELLICFFFLTDIPTPQGTQVKEKEKGLATEEEKWVDVMNWNRTRLFALSWYMLVFYALLMFCLFFFFFCSIGSFLS